MAVPSRSRVVGCRQLSSAETLDNATGPGPAATAANAPEFEPGPGNEVPGPLGPPGPGSEPPSSPEPGPPRPPGPVSPPEPAPPKTSRLPSPASAIAAASNSGSPAARRTSTACRADGQGLNCPQLGHTPPGCAVCRLNRSSAARTSALSGLTYAALVVRSPTVPPLKTNQACQPPPAAAPGDAATFP